MLSCRSKSEHNFICSFLLFGFIVLDHSWSAETEWIKFCESEAPLWTCAASTAPLALSSHFTIWQWRCALCFGVCLTCVLDGGGEETAAGTGEASSWLHQTRVCRGGVEMEERVSLELHFSASSHLQDFFLNWAESFCSRVSQERRRDLPAAEEAGSFSGLE